MFVAGQAVASAVQGGYGPSCCTRAFKVSLQHIVESSSCQKSKISDCVYFGGGGLDLFIFLRRLPLDV